ncbi:uncharacterized protein PHACADRAFT_134990 [Phanerochaete carnosa HHB-10118-sp]|uniref:Histone deacetylase interacting domain-containing protein n=1 Tax=Phanerochaete carnosa (strain HHB-10118-sp) TaxID=650164 RepID=K5VEG9_PHACS|nr:uncharacterized protein PHACADRAFT_134990 [Phanerochaete carnosa HHB-10118-sp]EKM61386.1 hypothetical protein PHACADRAFT_134990 [Phanerochaete carnosa HHB-10118-sp]
MAESTQLVGPAVPRSPDAGMARPLNVSDALGYLDAVKVQFQDKPDVYNHFLDIMKDFKSQAIDTPGVIHRVSTLFQGNPTLIQGFNTFLPPGYRIELSSDPRNLNGITVTTPTGIMDPFHQPMRHPPREPQHLPNAMPPHFPLHPPFAGHAPPPILPVGLGPGSRPTTPLNHGILPHAQSAFMDASRPYSPAMQGAHSAAASFLGGLGNGRTVEKSSVGEFNHAIQFLNKIKIRYSDEPDIYKQFLEILQTYQKEQKQLHDSQVYAQVARLFRDAPDLMEEFKDFLPEALGHSIQPQSGLVGIMPHPAAPTSPPTWDLPDAPLTGMEKATKAPNRRRKRAVDKDTTQSKAGGSRAVKRTKLNNKQADAASPRIPPFQQRLPTPEPLHPSQRHTNEAPQVQQHLAPPAAVPSQAGSGMNGVSQMSQQDELLFFDKTKKTLESAGTYEDFLKLIQAFAKEVIDTHALIQLSGPLLADGDLWQQFKELLGWDDKKGNVEYGPPGSIRTSAPDPQAPTCPDDDEGPSYRRLPPHETKLACSGRDQLAWAVLNDEWVSHPTWASEESGFLTHKKNSFEETLHRSEEERHEYQTHIDSITRIIAVLDPINTRINEMKPEERSQFRLGSDLGGWSPAIYQKTLKKVYGRDHWPEIYVGLQENPVTAVPIVLSRLKQKNEEWRRQQREWNRTWREVDAKNFYKALDHQGITFKANDKKNITAKYFVQDIEFMKAAQVKEREERKDFRLLGYQLEYEFQDREVLQDTLKMIYSFLDHSTSQYGPSERRGIENFLKSFLPTLFSSSSLEFDAPVILARPPESGTSNDLEVPAEVSEMNGRRSVPGAQSSGVPAGDLRKRLLKTVQEGTSSRAVKQSHSGSVSPVTAGSPRTPKGAKFLEEAVQDSNIHSKAEDMWIREIPGSAQGGEAGDAPVQKRPFFTSTTFYTLLRLIQLMYSRLLICKGIGAESTREKHASLLANPVAVELGLDEPNGPSVILAQAIEAVGTTADGGSEEPNVLYLYFLDACEKVFANELDQATFEEHMRWFFRTKAYHVFTLDKVVTAVIKQVQTILVDNKCQELWDLLESSRAKENVTLYDIIRYRREAEHHVGSDDHLYRVDCDRESRKLRIQLLSKDDPSANEDDSTEGRWREYLTSYVLRHPTEWLPRRSLGKGPRRGPVYLKRNLIDTDVENRQYTNEAGLCIRVSLGSYRLFYEAGKEDSLFQRRSPSEEATLAARALARSEERRRSRWLK